MRILDKNFGNFFMPSISFSVPSVVKSWLFVIFVSLGFLLGSAQSVFAKDIFINILALNGTESEKEKEIKQLLPKELTVDDIVDTAGLNLDYDVNAGTYFVEGKVKLGPKESRTLKVRVRDVWYFEKEDITDIKEQVEASYERVKETDYAETGVAKREQLLDKLDFILSQQNELASDIERRIDYYRTYSGEFDDIRRNSLSVKYWRTKMPELDLSKTITLIIELENPSDEEEDTIEGRYYLPGEVKPEHIVDLKGFRFRYDDEKNQGLLTKEEKLEAGEKKRYEIEIIDIWRVPQEEIDGLKDRTRKAYALLEKSEYAESAGYLVESIKENLTAIEESQKIDREIREHISAYRTNEKRYKKAEEDVKALEELLEAVRENLEKSKVKSVLSKIRSLKTLADIAQTIFKKPAINTAWKIILGIIIFVGLLTGIHFAVWGKKSKEAKKEEAEKNT